MATGAEIRRLRGSISTAKVAEMIGVRVDRLRKWEERDTDPKDTGDVEKVERYFNVSLAELKGLKSFDFVSTIKNPDQNDQDLNREIIDGLKNHIEVLQQNLADLRIRREQIEAIEKNLDAVANTVLVVRAAMISYHEWWISHYPPKGMTPQQVLKEIRKKTLELMEEYGKAI